MDWTIRNKNLVVFCFKKRHIMTSKRLSIEEQIEKKE